MTKEETLRLVEQEFVLAKQAAAAGNDGMVRVCARRAAGVAIVFWLQFNDRPAWQSDSMSRLRHLEADPTFPLQIREAATRLTARITEKFTPRFPSDPIEDSVVIIRHLLG
jgi:hypothetical protein